LVSTSIIESGLDIPTANTIIVDRADMFGLAQLYQIRGRVGRSNAQAYAYLTYPEHFKLSSLAEKKLTILQSLDSLGAGFSIASHDMEIRGYGNLVGDEQSGHIKEIGVELYQHLLEEEIRKIKENDSSIQETMDNWSPVLNVGVSVQIPANYIDDPALRLSFYRRIAAINDVPQLEALAAEMTDRFGALPDQAEHLISIIKLKQIAKKANVEKVDLGKHAVIITFRNNIAAYPEKIIDLIQNNPKTVKLKQDQKLLITHTWKNPSDIIKGIERILYNFL
jgi:transcription-repair coupling factor (superfamily II helicase)